ncbi:MAG: iron chelate uptake ABC transporter family permease subunit [Methanothrix sp.]|nr:iron chelate uptake ABC transporter family permease subunit [Methanothrix sp.]
MTSHEVQGADARHQKSHKCSLPKEEYQRFLGRKMLFFLIIILAVILLASLAVTFGSANLRVTDVYVAILAKFLPTYFQTTHFAYTIIWGLRLERIIMGIVAGMGLSVAGAAMQGILRNPLASEFTLGISSAASFGAALAIDGRRFCGRRISGDRQFFHLYTDCLLRRLWPGQVQRNHP